MIDGRRGAGAVAADQHRRTARRRVLADRRPLHARVVVAGLRRAPPGGPAHGCVRSCAVTGDRRPRRADHRGRAPAAAASRPTRSICAAGAWSRELGAMVGVDLPVEPAAPPDPHHRADAGPGPAHAVHHRLRHLVLLPRRGPGPAAGHVRPATRPRASAQPVRRLAAPARRGHRATRPRRCATSGSRAAGPGSTR